MFWCGNISTYSGQVMFCFSEKENCLFIVCRLKQKILTFEWSHLGEPYLFHFHMCSLNINFRNIIMVFLCRCMTCFEKRFQTLQAEYSDVISTNSGQEMFCFSENKRKQFVHCLWTQTEVLYIWVRSSIFYTFILLHIKFLLCEISRLLR